MRETADEDFHAAEVSRLRAFEGLALVICGPRGLRTFPLQDNDKCVIGRDSSCDLSLPVPALSRQHARFVRRAGSVVVQDLGSRHGTWLGAERIEMAELKLGAAVRLADVVVAVSLQQASPDALGSLTSNALVPDALYASPRMQAIQAYLHKVARTDLPVTLLGETGTGKELAAREIHLASARGARPMRVLNCAAIPSALIESTLFGHERGAFTGADRAQPGVFEAADGGTVFLDEVGELSPASQAALLRVLESKRLCRVGSTREIAVDVRIVAATHRDLRTMAAEGKFRLDLLHRLCVITVELPPLRERREDIVPLVRYFLSQTSGGVTEIESDGLSSLEGYAWPGNVRELRNVLSRAVVLSQGPSITQRELVESIGRSPLAIPVRSPAVAPLEPTLPSTSPASLRKRIAVLEHQEVQRALDQTGGNQRRAAELLAIPLRTLERRLRNWRVAEAASAQAEPTTSSM